MNKNVNILIDNGHGNNTPGKCSPDKRLLEYKYNREIAQSVHKQLQKEGYNSIILVPEITDVPLKTRSTRANKYNSKNTILVSIHCNAAGNGDWKTASGWSVWTSNGQTKGDKLADCMFEAAEEILQPMGQKLMKQTYNDGDVDYESNFHIIAKTKCPACLVENFFMDSKKDVEFLLSEKGKKAIIDLHVNGIKKYIEKYF